MSYRIGFATSPAVSPFAPLLFAGDVEQAARAAGELGFDGIEINTKGPEELPVATLRRLLQENQLQLVTLSSGRIYVEEKATLSDPDPEVRRRVIARVQRLAEMAAEFQAPLVIGLLRGQHLVDGDAEKTIALFADSAATIAETAGRLGIDIYIEAINRYETPLLNTAEQTNAVVGQIGAPNVKVLLDVFHMNIEEVSIAEAIRSTGDLLGHFHVADSNRHAPGMGHVDFAEIGTALRDIRYRGWVSGEHLPLPDSYTAARITQTFCSQL